MLASFAARRCRRHSSSSSNSSGNSAPIWRQTVASRNKSSKHSNSIEEELQQLDRDSHLEELQQHWEDYVQERQRHIKHEDGNITEKEEDEHDAELVLAELELNRTGVKYLIEQASEKTKQAEKLPTAKQQGRFLLPTRLLLNSCRYRETDGTARLLVRHYLPLLSPRLMLLRLEAAYVGHLPQATAECLLHGLRDYEAPSSTSSSSETKNKKKKKKRPPTSNKLQTLQLVDWDLRPQPVADKLSALFARPSPSSPSLLQLQTLELRHCRVNAHTLERLGHVLSSSGTQLQRLTIHACVLDDALFAVFCQALCGGGTDKEGSEDHGNEKTDTNDNDDDNGDSSASAKPPLLKHVSLPSNRLTVASLPNLANLLNGLPHLVTLDLQRMSRLFYMNPNHNREENGDDNNNVNDLESGLALLSAALEKHTVLQTLDLSRCGVSDLVANALFRSLSSSSSSSCLQELLLGNNSSSGTDLLTGTGDWVLQSLPHLTHLRRLDLPRHASNWYSPQPNSNKDGHPLVSHDCPFRHALRQNTSLVSVSCDGALLVEALPVLHRNHWLRHVQTLLQIPKTPPKNATNHSSDSPEPMLNDEDNGKDITEVVEAFSPLWPQVLHACRAAEGSTARYAVLQAHAVQWTAHTHAIGGKD